MTQDLEGIKILDFTQILAGPFAAQQLGLLGADVIKIEPVNGGDQMRDRMLPSRLANVGMASAFMTLNLGKRSLALDLKHPDGRATAMRLIGQSDVMLHNFRAGVVDRLGLDWPRVRAVNPRLVYCSISGFGNLGPRSRDAAFDGAIQAASGMMSNNGHPDTGPTRTGYFPVDMMTGMTAAFAVSAALLRRQRTGRGKAVDVAMLDSAITLQAAAFAQYFVDENPGGLTGNSSTTGAPSADRFSTADGLVLMSAVSQSHVEALCTEMGIADRLEDPRFATAAARAANAAEFRNVLDAAFASDSAENWSRRLSACGVPVSRVNSIAGAAAERQLEHRGVFVDVRGVAGVDAGVRLVGAAFTADEAGPQVSRPPPALGEHSREVLVSFGFDHGEIDRLIAAGVVAERPGADRLAQGSSSTGEAP